MHFFLKPEMLLYKETTSRRVWCLSYDTEKLVPSRVLSLVKHQLACALLVPLANWLNNETIYEMNVLSICAVQNQLAMTTYKLVQFLIYLLCTHLHLIICILYQASHYRILQCSGIEIENHEVLSEAVWSLFWLSSQLVA